MDNMGDILDSPIVLRLNGLNQRIGWATVAQAFTAMMGGTQEHAAYLAVDIEHNLKEDGTPDYSQTPFWRPVSFEEWRTLPIRAWDMSINTVKGKIRVPTVVICMNFKIMPKKKQKATPANIRKRDGNRCQYTGVPLTNKTFSLDHIIPRSKGGKDNWENLVSAHKDVNSQKGNKFNHEAGLKLKKRPAAPRETPLCVLYQENKHPDHQFFA